ncbi:hypothetical protein B0T22DRAFT_467540 [Podospora appendiculata]|uniref:Uncharacterized protein n=1 Tax=Podospora appendiculata TaxID=314037 RepID=A0AAE0X7C2_9PEZI|nr:hypothetical protein B0T22DRAFT_467540 [Podospora appendiculata]
MGFLAAVAGLCSGVMVITKEQTATLLFPTAHCSLSQSAAGTNAPLRVVFADSFYHRRVEMQHPTHRPPAYHHPLTVRVTCFQPLFSTNPDRT